MKKILYERNLKQLFSLMCIFIYSYGIYDNGGGGGVYEKRMKEK